MTVVHLNGRWLAAEAARVSVFDHGFLYGDGLFETVRAYGGRLFAAEAHFARLAASAARIGLDLPFDGQGFANLLTETLERNRLSDTLLRLTLTRGEGPPVPDPAGCGDPTVLVVPRPAPVADPGAWRRGLSVVLARDAVAGPDGGLKSLSFLPRVRAVREARERGADEAVLLSPTGDAAEGSVSNLFGVWDGVLATPPEGPEVLPGVTRRLVLDLAAKIGVRAGERALSPKDLEGAEELFVTSTGWEVMPVTRLEGRPVGSGMPGPVTERLHRAYRTAVETACGLAQRGPKRG